MKIYTLKIKNLRGIVELSEEVEGASVIKATGKNGAGKSSFIDAILLALKGGRYFSTGKGAKYSAAEIINSSGDSAEVTLTIGDAVKKIEITRKVTPDGRTNLEIINSSGEAMNQADLDALLNALAIDPVDVSKSTPLEQVEILKPLLPEGIDIIQLEETAEEEDEKRGEADRKLSAIYGQQKEPEPEEIQKVSVSALSSELIEAEKKNKEFEVSGRERKGITDYLQNLEAQIEETQRRIRELENVKIEAVKKLENLPAEKSKMIDTAKIRERLENAEAINEKAGEYEVWKKRQSEIQKEKELFEIQSREATLARDGARNEIGEALSLISKEISILWDSKGGLKIKGKRLAEMSTSEAILAGVWFSALLHKRNPATEKMDILIIRDGNVLDQESFEKLKKLAHKNGLQILIELVENEENLKIVLEEAE